MVTRGFVRSATWRTAVALLVIAGIVAAACAPQSGTAPSASAKDPASITVLVTSSPSATALQALAPAFTKQTGIAVKFVEVPYAEVAPKLLLAAKANESTYDVSQFDSSFMAGLAAGGALLPLDSFLKDTPAYDVSDFPQKVLDYAKFEGVTYGLNLSTEPYVLWYRTDLFSQLKLKPPTNSAEYLANAIALKGAGYFGSDSAYGPAFAWSKWAEAVYLRGGRFLDPNTNQPRLTAPDVIESTKYYMSLVPFTPKSAVNGGGNDMNTAFIQTEVGQEINATGYYSIMADPKTSKVVGKFDAALAPREKIGPYDPLTLMFGWLIGVSKTSQYPEAAKKFLNYVLAKAQVSAFVDAGAPPPARKSTVANPAILKTLPYLPTLLAASDVGEHAPYIPEMAQIGPLISKHINAMATGQETVEAGLAAANVEVTKVLTDAGRIKK